MQSIEPNWLLILLVLVVAVLIAWYIFHAARRTRVTGDRRDVLDEGAAPAARNRTLIDAPAAAPPQMTTPPPTPVSLAGAGEAVAGAVERQASDTAGEADGADDLTRLKGVGPKLAAQLSDMGVSRFAEIAAWDDADIDRIDAQLGRFEGRIRRDGWVEQARLLAAGDTAGFAARFGAIS